MYGTRIRSSIPKEIERSHLTWSGLNYCRWMSSDKGRALRRRGANHARSKIALRPRTIVTMWSQVLESFSLCLNVIWGLHTSNKQEAHPLSSDSMSSHQVNTYRGNGTPELESFVLTQRPSKYCALLATAKSLAPKYLPWLRSSSIHSSPLTRT